MKFTFRSSELQANITADFETDDDGLYQCTDLSHGELNLGVFAKDSVLNAVEMEARDVLIALISDENDAAAEDRAEDRASLSRRSDYPVPMPGQRIVLTAAQMAAVDDTAGLQA